MSQRRLASKFYFILPFLWQLISVEKAQKHCNHFLKSTLSPRTPFACVSSKNAWGYSPAFQGLRACGLLVYHLLS